MKTSILVLAVSALSILTAAAAAAPGAAQEHTVISLSHSDFTIYELDPAAGRVASQYTARDQPHEGAVSPDGRTVYVTIPSGEPTGHVVVLDATQGLRLVKTIESEHFHRFSPRGASGGMNALPHGVALNTDGSKLYITAQWAEVPKIVVYDTRAGREIGTIDVLLEGGRQLAVDRVTDKLYYPMYDDDRVVVIDTKTDRIVNVVPVPANPVHVDFVPGREAWIHSDGDGSVTVIDMATDRVVDRIDTGSEGSGRLTVSPDGRWVASTRGGSGTVVLIDARAREVVATVPIGSGGFPLFSPDGTRVYVMSSRPEGGISVVDVASRRVEARHTFGTNPYGGAIRYVRGRR